MNSKKRILIVDDNKSIHEDIKKILATKIVNAEIDKIEELLFDEKKKTNAASVDFAIDDAYQGEEAIEKIDAAAKEEFPYSLVFMDVRMPPGIDGIETIHRIWSRYPNIEMVICTAYSDYSWDEIMEKFGFTDQLLFIKKPFDAISLKQITYSLTAKWEIARKNKEYLTYLELEVEKRTAELKKLLDYMRTLKEKAEDSDRMKSSFLSNMSHEIRSPMTAILGFSTLLENEGLSPEKKGQFISYINNSGAALLQIINDIIDISKIEAHQLKLYMSECNLYPILVELKDIFDQQTAQRNKNIQIIINESALDKQLRIYSDPLRLKQIFFNLLSNALKFTSKGSVEFGYTIDNDLIQFYVKDTGVGISDDKKDVIFKRFGQADDFFFKNAMGTGLGLAISKNLVEIMGGKIWLESELNVGTTFYFSLPFKPMNDTIYIEPKIIVPEMDSDFHNKRILIAEDEEINFIFFHELFSIKKIEVDWAKNGQEALEKLSGENHYDLVLMDIKMPIMDGIEALGKIKQLNKKIPPVIAQTAFALIEEKEKYLELGFYDYISKPIKIDELFIKLRKWLAHA
jgi:two-component system sensor histidine kinase/response regulator